MVSSKYSSIAGFEVDLNKKILNLVSKKELEYTKKHKPYCSRCAKNDIREKILSEVRLQEARNGFIDFDGINTDLTEFEKGLDNYGKEERFEVLEETDAWSRARGETTERIIGKNTDFKCKYCSAGISVLVPIEDIKINKK